MDIFFDNFERTEYTDTIHGILGRAMIIAARFDSMWNMAALLLEFKKNRSIFASKEDIS